MTFVGSRHAVSVVVPTRDRPDLLRRTLRSVASQDPGLVGEVLVVFDQSSADQALMREFSDLPIRLLENRRSPGLAGARNTGLIAASGEWVAFCDDDDEWVPSKLTEQLAAITHHASFIVSGISVEFHGEFADRIPDVRSLGYRDFLDDRVMAAHPSTFLVRRAAAIEGFGLVDESIPGSYAEDYEWLLRASRRGPVLVVRAPLSIVHWHESSYFADRWMTIADALRYLTEKHPEIRTSRRGFARIEGQRAFALAAAGSRRAAMKSAGASLRSDWRERRAFLALLIAGGATRTETLLRMAHRRGRGI